MQDIFLGMHGVHQQLLSDPLCQAQIIFFEQDNDCKWGGLTVWWRTANKPREG